MSNYTYYSEMMREDKETFLTFVNNMISHYKRYLMFVNSVEHENYRGIYLVFYELDGDGFDSGNVHKWSVEFIPSHKDGVHLNFRGYSLDRVYRLYDNEQGKFLVEGSYEETMDYVYENEWLNQECEKLVTQEAINTRFIWKNIDIDVVKDWTSKLEGVIITTEPDNIWEGE